MKINDGWHTIKGCDVYVEDGKVTRGMKKDRNGSYVSAYPYRASRSGGWDKAGKISVSAFAAGVRRGTIKLF